MTSDWMLAVYLICVAGLAGSCAWRNRRELEAWLGRDPFARRRILRSFVYVCAAACCALAWRVADRKPPSFEPGADDVVLAIDVSRSMAVSDSPPSRLRRAARIAEQLIAADDGLRIGLVLFAGEPFTALPLTLDRTAVLPYLSALDTDLISRRGSDLARALLLAGTLFDAQSERARTILLLSDGEHAGESLDAALERLRSEGVRVLAIGFGKAEGGIVPSRVNGGVGEDGSADGRREIRSARRDDLLTQIATRTQGVYWREWEERPSNAEVAAALRKGRTAATAGPRSDSEAWLSVLLLVCALLWMIEWALMLEPSSRLAGSRRLQRHRTLQRVAVSALALVLVSATDDPRIRRADALLAGGDEQAALRIYQRVESEGVASPALSVRMGNAQYRLRRFEHAAAHFLNALRAEPPASSDLRFRAHFNLGNALAELERHAEAREAFWSALLERPGDREAQYNYEWVLERIPEPEADEQGQPDESGDPQDEGEGEATEADGGEGESRMDAAEAQRWIERLEDRVDGALRQQIEREMAERGAPQPSPEGQTW